MDPEPILLTFLRFLARLDPDSLDESGALDELQSLLAFILPDDLLALNEPIYSFERTDWSADANDEARRLQKLRERDWRIDLGIDHDYRLFKRELPLAQALLAGSQPAWAAGIAPERSIGPLVSQDGRRFWFDLYPIRRLVPIYRRGEEAPALLFSLSTIPVPRREPDVAGKLLARFNGLSLELESGSFWVRSDILALHGPADKYVGFQIEGGRIELNREIMPVQGRAFLAGNTTCSVALRLAEATTSGAARPLVGAPKLRTPRHLAFHFSQNERATDEVGDAHMALFDEPFNFTWTQSGRPFFNSDLNTLLVPLQPDKRAFAAQDARSDFAQMSGGAAIRRSGWLLPVVELSLPHPPAATNNGGLAVLGNSDLTLDWRGLRDGPIDLPQPWVIQFPGLTLIFDPQAGNLLAWQRFLFWQDEGAPYRSSVEARFGRSFPLFYAVDDQGAELLLAQVNAEAKLDRPVDAAGKALDIRTKASMVALSFSQKEALVYLYDENIIMDNLDPQSPITGSSLGSVALVMRNSLFSATPVNGFLLFAELLDEELVDVGSLFLIFGLYGFLPTLPDPYAANVAFYRRLSAVRDGRGRISMLLLCWIKWRQASAGNADDVRTNFHLQELGQRADNLLMPLNESRMDELLGDPRCKDLDANWDECRGNEERMDRCGDYLWDCAFGRFNDEQFALLDVSTKADWMGVSMSWFDQERLQDNEGIFYRIYAAQDVGERAQNLFPLQVRGLDVTAEGRFVRAFALPQTSWEPLFVLPQEVEPGQPPPPRVDGDPYLGLNIFMNDGGPTRLFNDNRERVPITPLSKVEELLSYFKNPQPGFTGALFTLPFGLRAFAEINKKKAQYDAAGLRLNQETFRDGHLTGGLQIQVNAPKREEKSPMFIGGTLQLTNLRALTKFGDPQNTLGGSVATIFNQEFFTDTNGGYGKDGVPLTRIDFSGYGSSTFSRWENPGAAFAETSQARFDIFIGRTAHEVIQVKSIIYPWGIRVVRTIIIFRAATSYMYRYDTGWKAESDGLYDFSYKYRTAQGQPKKTEPNPYEIHPGVVQGIFNVHNIAETTDFGKFAPTVTMGPGDHYIDDSGYRQDYAVPENVEIVLQPVYFDADVAVDFLKGGAANARTPTRKMLGFVQLKPRGLPIPPGTFRDLLRRQLGAVGGPVDCLINIGNTGQQMRVTRVEVGESVNGNAPVFVGTARGSVVLPKDGSWSVVQVDHGTKEVAPLDDNGAVPLIRRGKLGTKPTDPLRLDNPIELIRPPQSDSTFYGLLQSTGTQKALFRQPRFAENVAEMLSEKPDFADAYRMLNSTGIFPNLKDTIPLDLGAFKTHIIEAGYQLLDKANPDKILQNILPSGPLFIIKEDFLKLYIEYEKRDDKTNTKEADGVINFGFDSAAGVGKRWLSKMNDITMLIDLGPLTRVMKIKGKFDAEQGAAPSFQKPELEFSDELQPVVDLLEILSSLQTGKYADALGKGLEVAMSNSADNWAYAFHARKEIPLIRFPSPDPGPTAPLRLEASMSVGVYFNEVLALPSSPNQLIPSAGAFLEFYDRLAVMCVSVAAATIYATGSVDLRLAADINTGPSLHMKFGFGAEIVVGLPVIGNVSIMYMVGVQIDLDSGNVAVAAFLLYRGRAEILGGLVTVTISIEAKGTYTRTADDKTNMTAQVTFGLDISIFLVVNISFSESWQETRQIA